LLIGKARRIRSRGCCTAPGAALTALLDHVVGAGQLRSVTFSRVARGDIPDQRVKARVSAVASEVFELCGDLGERHPRALEQRARSLEADLAGEVAQARCLELEAARTILRVALNQRVAVNGATYMLPAGTARDEYVL
jgi:hypothetical protein